MTGIALREDEPRPLIGHGPDAASGEGDVPAPRDVDLGPVVRLVGLRGQGPVLEREALQFEKSESSLCEKFWKPSTPLIPGATNRMMPPYSFAS